MEYEKIIVKDEKELKVILPEVLQEFSFDDLIIEVDGVVYKNFEYGIESSYQNIDPDIGIVAYTNSKNEYVKIKYRMHTIKPGHYQGIKEILKVETF